MGVMKAERSREWIRRSLGGMVWCAGILAIAVSTIADEGMYPISELGRLDLCAARSAVKTGRDFQRRRGLPGRRHLPSQRLHRLVCIAERADHHESPLRYDAIQNASSVEHDYLQDGFQARTLGEEIPAKGYTVRVTESFRDVSAEVLSAVHEEMNFADRSRAIDKRRKELEQQAERDHPGLRAEVAEMFLGKTYVLFRYTYLKDIRLVFAPPSSVGNFGGEVDNWHWPRHTGDFSFMRAYDCAGWFVGGLRATECPVPSQTRDRRLRRKG